LHDFIPEVTSNYGEPIPVSASFPMTAPPTHAIDTTSRVISFVLGFALASLIAWVGSISSDGVAATGNSEPVAAVGTPVAATATQQKPVTRTEDEAPVQLRSQPSAAAATTGSPAAAPVAATPRLVAPTRPSSTVGVASTAAPQPAGPVSSNATAVRVSGYRGGLSLSSSPAGAQVVLNGEVVGQTPVVLKNLPVGSRGVVVRRDGYSPWSTTVRIVADQLTTVKANLVPAPANGG
jgi:hypothetical protein